MVNHDAIDALLNPESEDEEDEENSEEEQKLNEA